MTAKYSLLTIAALLSALVSFTGCATTPGVGGGGGHAGASEAGPDGPSFGGTGGTGASGGSGGAAGSSGGGGASAGGSGFDGGAGSSSGGAGGSSAGSGGTSSGGMAGTSSGGMAGTAGSAGSDGGVLGPENSCPGVALTFTGSGSNPRTANVSGSNMTLTDNAQGTCTLNVGGSDAVYSFTAPIAGAVDITLTTNFNASLYVRKTCNTASSQVACDNESGFAVDKVSFVTKANATYYVFVDGSETGQVGSFQLSIKLTPAGPENTCPGVSGTFTGTGTQQSATIQGNTSADSDSTSGSCVGAGQNDAVYAFKAPISGHMNVTMLSTAFDGGLYARTSCASTSTEVACADNTSSGATETISFPATSGTTYYVFVDGSSGGGANQNGPFTLTASIAKSGPEDTCPGKAVSFYPAGSGETALVQGDTSADSGSTSGSCVGANQNDAVYAFTPTMNGTMNVVLQDPTFDGGLYARTTCTSTGTELACSDSGTQGQAEAITFSVLSGKTYYVFVDGYDNGMNDAGPFTLTATVIP